MTDFWILLMIAFGLAMDCFAVSLGTGASPSPCTPRSILRLSFHFGLFQGGMTLLGSTVVNLISGFNHWIAMLLLAWVGRRMVFEGLTSHAEKPVEECNDPTRGSSLIMLSVATSIDALGVGLSLALLKVDVIAASLVIGAVSLIVSVIDLLSGKRLSRRFGKGVEVMGGLVLVAIGLRIVLTHTIL
jgi:putative Mn2+ efflux pump MntP